MITTLGLDRFPVQAREHRESFTDQQIQARLAAAEGTAASTDIATVTAIARLWEFAFSAGQSKILQPWQLGRIGRALVLSGESIWYSGTSGLLPVSDHDIQGRSAVADRWQYRITMPAPSRSITKRVPADRIMHVRIGATTARPWAGVSPLVEAKATRGVIEAIESSLSQEHGGPVGHVIGVPDPEGSGAVADGIANLKGRTILAEASAARAP